ncbi:MAG: zinc ribbon domain-containing protein [Actinobacteria bacterium]|nr:zinc ribbon domain-containing protein [Actinomycetota bacterium]
MPTYDLECHGCGLRFEVFRQGFLRDEDLACAACGATDVGQRYTGFVTSRPPRDRTEPSVRGFGHACSSGCGCARARAAPDGTIVPP